MLIHLSRVMGSLAALTLLALPATAQINVDYLNGSNWVNLAQLAAGSNVSITDTGSLTYRVYALAPTTQSIGAISISSASGATPVLFVGQGLTVPVDHTALSTPGALHVGAISFSGGQPQLQLRVNRNATGEISFWRIVRLDVGGTIQANVIHDPFNHSGTAPMPPASHCRCCARQTRRQD